MSQFLIYLRFGCMPQVNLALRILLLSGLAVVLAILPAQSLHAQTTSPSPSSTPLLNRDGGGVKPNVMLTIDDSGSMLFQHMPDKFIYLGNSTTASLSPVATVSLAGGFFGSYSIRMHPADPFVLTSTQGGAVAGSTTSANLQQAYLRSPDMNTVYYNPEIRYLPWVKPDATRMPNSTVTSARLDPTGASLATVSLATITSITTQWCAAPGSTAECGEVTMSAAAVSRRFNPMLYYRLQKNANGSYKTPTMANFNRFDLNPVTSTGAAITSGFPTFTKHPARTDCTASTTSCSLAEERQNFANWFTYYRSRAFFAKGGISESFVDATNTFRLGYGRINDTTNNNIDGVNSTVIAAGVRDFTTTVRSSVTAWLQAMPISGGTPLRIATDAIGKYYRRGDNGGPWSDDPAAASAAAHKTCRRAYHFLVTDGYWNDTPDASILVGNVDASNYVKITGPNSREYQYTPDKPYTDSNSNFLADYAMYYWRTDLRGATGTTAIDNNIPPSAENPAFWQSMSNFVIGLGVRGTLNPATDLPSLTSGTKTWGSDRIDDLWHAAINSRGAYFSVKDTSELSAAIKNSLNSAVERELRESGVATSSAVLEDGNRKYVPQFRTSAWNGDVQAFSLDQNGQAGALQWTAESRLPAWASRNIVTWDTGPTTPLAVSFTWAAMSSANRSALGSITSTYTATFVDFLRGDRSKESTGASLPFRARDGVLGDFINSNPVLIKSGFDGGYGSLTTGGSAYAQFLADKSARTGVLFIGSNAGMLHGFQDPKSSTPSENGKEVFAYVPRAIYPSLATLATKTYGTTANYHRYMVDGGLREADAFVPPPAGGSAEWRNYLVGSTGAGARAVFALDVTSSPSLGGANVRWEKSNADDGDIGYVMAAPEVGVLSNGEWVMIFGNGYFSDTQQAKLMIVKISDGTIMKVPVGTAGSNGLGGVGLVRNDKGEITRIYAGDLDGKVWRFDYDSTASSTGWFKVGLGGNELFSGASTKPISQPPAVYKHTNAAGGYLVVFGTGQLVTAADATSTSVQTLYGVWDKSGDTPPVSASSLQSRPITSFAGTGGATFYKLGGADIDWSSTDRGWYIDLSVVSGLRTIYPPTVISDKLVLMSSVAPAANVASCESGVGRGLNLVFDVFTGKAPAYPLFDTNADGAFTASDELGVAGTSTNADGQDAIVRGTTVTKSADNRDCRKLSLQNTTGQMMLNECGEPAVAGSGAISDRVWRRIVNPPIR